MRSRGFDAPHAAIAGRAVSARCWREGLVGKKLAQQRLSRLARTYHTYFEIHAGLVRDEVLLSALFQEIARILFECGCLRSSQGPADMLRGSERGHEPPCIC